jgi:hypothetical protein
MNNDTSVVDGLKKQLQERANQLLGSDPQWAYLKGRIDGIEESQKAEVADEPKKAGK